MSITEQPTYAYTDTGSYNVCLIVSTEAYSDTLCRMINVSCDEDIDLTTFINEIPSFVYVYPNPTSGMVNIEINGFEGVKQIRMTDAVGKLVYIDKVVVNKQIHLDLTGQSKGLYYLIITGDNITQVISLIKE